MLRNSSVHFESEYFKYTGGLTRNHLMRYCAVRQFFLHVNKMVYLAVQIDYKYKHRKPVVLKSTSFSNNVFPHRLCIHLFNGIIFSFSDILLWIPDNNMR